MWRFVLCGLMMATVCLADAPNDEAVKKELEKLQGTWKVIKSFKEGQERAADGAQVVIAGDKLTIKDKPEDLVARFKIDPSKKPTTIDLSVEGEKLPGIYELNKDMLKICVDNDGKIRPAGFSEKGKTTSLLILQREKK